MSDAPSAIHSIVLPFHLTVFASWFCGDRQERAYPLPRALFATASQLLQSAGPDCPGPACPRPLQKPVLGSGRVSFPWHQGARRCQAGRPAIGWEEGSNPNCLLYLANQGSRLIAGSQRRCLGGVWHLCLSSRLRLPGAASPDSFRAGFVSLCHLPAAPEPPRAAGLAPCHAGRRCPTDNQGQWKCRLRLP